MKKWSFIGLALLLCLMQGRAQELAWERLPDLAVPRSGHALLYLNGELTVIGGHTTGFVPAATAEYYKDGKWLIINSLYHHDYSFFLPLRDGSVLVGGGMSEPFGVGQSLSVERYQPLTHSFEPVSILDRKRAGATAAELGSGTILVSGNWYADDALEQYSAQKGFEYVKEMAESRGFPWILPTAPDNAVIFSAVDSKGAPGQGWVDRLHGEPFQVPLLLSARPLSSDADVRRVPCEIGDYDHLILAHNDSLQAIGILRVHGEEFSLLELETAIPLEGVNGPIRYYHRLLCHGGDAWALGTDGDGRAYLLQIRYKPALEGGKATLKLYHTAPLEDLPVYGACAMLPDGRIALAGGIGDSNYTPYASVYLFDPYHVAAGSPARSRTAGLIAGILVALTLPGLGFWLAGRRKKPLPQSPSPDWTSAKGQRDRELFEKVSALMEEGLYTRKGLSISDLATTLGTNTKYISSCINTGAGCSFLDYVNGYRVRYAKKMMLENQSVRISEVAEASGFASESSFYRNFKAATGLTPNEWLARQ